MKHRTFTGTYCVKCGTAQESRHKDEPCAGIVGGALCNRTIFTTCVGVIEWDALNDDDAMFLKSIRVAVVTT